MPVTWIAAAWLGLALPSSNGPIDAHARRVQAMHEDLATKLHGTSPAASSRRSHNARQSSCFDEAASFFASEDATPASVAPLLREIAEAAELQPSQRVLDVGCGTGALIPFLKQCGVAEADVVGVELSGRMLSYARERFPEAKFLLADVCDVHSEASVHATQTTSSGSDTAECSLDTSTQSVYIHPVDVVVFNACFGNMWSQQTALRAATSVLLPQGRVLISHPLGAGFVRQLHDSDPETVPRPLPSQLELMRMLCSDPGVVDYLRLDRFQAGSSVSRASPDADVSPYIALLTQSPVKRLQRFRGLSGPVARGFGRGSRKLGTPTANLPCSLFQEALEDLQTGVYVGFARVRGRVHKAVANVGFSPTFGEEQNPEKVVETYVMHEFDEDFYAEPMRLLLLGYVRPERKFESLDALIRAITSDVATANEALECLLLQQIKYLPWLQDEDIAGSQEPKHEEFDALAVLTSFSPSEGDAV